MGMGGGALYVATPPPPPPPPPPPHVVGSRPAITGAFGPRTVRSGPFPMMC
jgi:hypothetical protein